MTEAGAKLVANIVCVILYKPGEFFGDQRAVRGVPHGFAVTEGETKQY